MKVSQADALSLLIKYAHERTPVFAAFVTPSRSTARVTGKVYIAMVGDKPQLKVGEDDQHIDQVKFHLSDCTFEYGDFRGEPDARHFEAFLVMVSSKGDTLTCLRLRIEGLFVYLQCSRQLDIFWSRR
jgi:hypothetical protein